MTRLLVSDYAAVLEPEDRFFRDWYALAEKVGGTVGLTQEGGLVITLPAGAPRADVVAAGLTERDFPYCYVVAGTDSVLVPDL